MEVTTSGIVLAGGRSRRMGTDKALIRWRGARLVDHAVAALMEVCDDVVVASGRRRIKGLAVPQVRDRPEDVGPIGGLAGALSEIDHELAFVLAVDLPTPDVDLLARLAEHWSGEAAVIPSARGRAHPLHAVWSADAAPAIATLAQGGTRAVLAVAEALQATILDEAQTASLVDHDRWTWNVNQPSDLEARGP